MDLLASKSFGETSLASLLVYFRLQALWYQASFATRSWPSTLQINLCSHLLATANLLESSAHLVTHFVSFSFTPFTLIVYLSQNRHLSAGNNTLLQEGAKDDRCLLEALDALSASIQDVDFLFTSLLIFVNL